MEFKGFEEYIQLCHNSRKAEWLEVRMEHKVYRGKSAALHSPNLALNIYPSDLSRYPSTLTTEPFARRLEFTAWIRTEVHNGGALQRKGFWY